MQEQLDKHVAEANNKEQQLQSSAAADSKLQQQQAATCAPRPAVVSLPKNSCQTQHDAAAAAGSPATRRKHTHSDVQPQQENWQKLQKRQDHWPPPPPQQQQAEQEQQETILIDVTHSSGPHMSYECLPDTSLKRVFKHFAKVMGTERAQLTFMFAGNRLHESGALCEYGINNGAGIDCFTKQTGC